MLPCKPASLKGHLTFQKPSSGCSDAEHLFAVSLARPGLDIVQDSGHVAAGDNCGFLNVNFDRPGQRYPAKKEAEFGAVTANRIVRELGSVNTDAGALVV